MTTISAFRRQGPNGVQAAGRLKDAPDHVQDTCHLTVNQRRAS